MSERLEAHYQNRIYYFYVTDQKEEELTIDMYKTSFIFIKKDDKWENHPGNRQQMVGPLIQVVATAAGNASMTAK